MITGSSLLTSFFFGFGGASRELLGRIDFLKVQDHSLQTSAHDFQRNKTHILVIHYSKYMQPHVDVLIQYVIPIDTIKQVHTLLAPLNLRTLWRYINSSYVLTTYLLTSNL